MSKKKTTEVEEPEPPEISAEDRKAGLDAVRRSLMYKVMCWDESMQAEKLLRMDIDTSGDGFEGLAGCIDDPQSFLRLPDADILEAIGVKPDEVFRQYPDWE